MPTSSVLVGAIYSTHRFVPKPADLPPRSLIDRAPSRTSASPPRRPPPLHPTSSDRYSGYSLCNGDLQDSGKFYGIPTLL
ncbi:hypothetical protein Aduo_019267 [Ancylostoma duodenale]